MASFSSLWFGGCSGDTEIRSWKIQDSLRTEVHCQSLESSVFAGSNEGKFIYQIPFSPLCQAAFTLLSKVSAQFLRLQCCFSSDYSSAFCDSPLLQHFHWHHPHASKNMFVFLLTLFISFRACPFSWISVFWQLAIFSLTSSLLTVLLTPLIDSGRPCPWYHTRKSF